jgi:hypothetical protein
MVLLLYTASVSPGGILHLAARLCLHLSGSLSVATGGECNVLCKLIKINALCGGVQAFLTNWNNAGMAGAGGGDEGDAYYAASTTKMRRKLSPRGDPAADAARRMQRAISSAAAANAAEDEGSGADSIGEFEADLSEVTVEKGLEKVRGEMGALQELLAQSGLVEADVATPTRAVKECLFHAVHAIVRMIVCDEVRRPTGRPVVPCFSCSV